MVLKQAAALAPIAAHFVRARWRWRVLRGARLARYQERRARRIVAHARRHAPFYRERWAGHDPREWRRLPEVDKGLMMANFDRFNTRGIRREAALAVALAAERDRDFRPTLDGLTVGLSSGTSGHRGLFLVDPWEQAAWAGVILARTIGRPRRLRVAFFLRSNSNLYERLGGALIQFRFFDLMLPLDDAVAALNGFRPDIVAGPPSLLGLLAGRARGDLRIRPERLISVAEVLEPHDRAAIEAAFAAPVGQIYQCTEGLLAISCAAGSLHVQEDLVALQFAPLPGAGDERVTPIVTDLWRTTQPIVRYRLNDVLQLEPRTCACGSPFRVIRAVEGRCDDVCYFDARAGGRRPFFPDTIRRMILLAGPNIADYQAVQERPGHLRVHLAVPPGADFDAVAASVRASIAATVAQYDCRPATVEIARGLLPLAAGAKRRRVRNTADE